MHYFETELRLLSSNKHAHKDQAQAENNIFEISPAGKKKKFNQSVFIFEKKNCKRGEEKKENFNIFSASKNKSNNNNNNNNISNNNCDSFIQIENTDLLFTSASPKKKEPKNIQLRKQENVNTFTKSNSLSTNSLNDKNSKATINQKLLNIEQRLKAYLKQSHKFFKTKSIDKFLENSESMHATMNLQGQLISEPDFERLCNSTLTPNKSFKAAGGCGSKGQNSFKVFNNNDVMNNNNSNPVLLDSSNNKTNSILSDANNNMNNKQNINMNMNFNNNNNCKTANLNASGFLKMQQSSNVSSINFSTANNHKAALYSTTPFNISNNGTIPSIFKNFFEEKEVKELNKKRHSTVVGEILHKNTLKNSNFSKCDNIKQKYQSNHTVLLNNSNFLAAKLNFSLTGGDSHENQNNSDSRISDFSVDMFFNNNNNNLTSDSNEDSLIQGLQEAATERSAWSGSFKILKRNSILKERRLSCKTNGYMNSFDVVVEEEKNAFGTNTSDEEPNSAEDECCDEKKCAEA